MNKIILTMFLLSAAHLIGCTDFVFQAKDGTYINGRTMEFASALDSKVVEHKKGEQRKSTSPDGKGLEWTSKYGYIGLNALNADVTVDGLNEEGLSFGALWLPVSEFPKFEPGKTAADKTVSLEDMGDWFLGNFKNVEEVKKGFAEIFVWGHPIEWFNNSIPPLHFTLHDKEGKNLVIEFVKGKINLHDNVLGVLTNDPAYDWQIANLSNYVKITGKDSPSIKLGDLTINSTGHGSGFLGIPGDWTPPSRFVRMAFFKSFATEPKDKEGGIILAFHLLNTVDIPFGAIVDQGEGKSTGDYTQWVVIKDLTNKVLYFRPYEELSMKKYELNK